VEKRSPHSFSATAKLNDRAFPVKMNFSKYSLMQWLTEVLSKIKDHPINKIKELLLQNYYAGTA